MKALVLAAAFGLAATSAFAAPEKYTLDASHSQIVFNYTHLGFSTTTGLISGFEGTINFDREDPAASSVDVSIPLTLMSTGWAARDEHLATDDFFGAATNPNVTFKSTAIEVTGDTTANITGDLTINGITKPVTLATTLTQDGEHPMAKKPWLGFNATTTVKRTDFDMGEYAPYVADDVAIAISIEAMKAE